MFNLV